MTPEELFHWRNQAAGSISFLLAGMPAKLNRINAAFARWATGMEESLEFDPEAVRDLRESMSALAELLEDYPKIGVPR